MKKNYADTPVDVCLIAASGIDLGVRALSSFLKEQGRIVAAGFFESWGLYTDEELESIVAWIRALDPKIIGVSSIEFSREKALQLMAALEGLGKPIVAGGADATLNPGIYLERASYVIRGEGEEAFAELAAAVCGGGDPADIRNLCRKDAGGQVRVNPVRPLIRDLDVLPFEDWCDVGHHFELKGGRVARKKRLSLEMHDQVSEHSQALFMLTVRGCVFDCAFCINGELKRLNPGEAQIRKRAIGTIVDRAAHLKKEDPSITIVYFFDDDFFLRTPEEIRRFAAAWKEKVRLPFFVNCTPLTVSEEKLAALVDAGLVTMTMGIQSGSGRVNAGLYERTIPPEAAVKASRLLSAYVGRGAFGLRPPLYDFIINNPYETAEDLMLTIRLCGELEKPYCTQMHSLKLFQGTRLYNRARADGLVSGKDEMTKYNCHDTLRHFEALVRRGGNFYLNSLLYWMNGFHTRASYGIVPARLLGPLTRSGTVEFFDRHPRLTAFLNGVLPTQKRIYNFREKVRKFLTSLAGK